MQKYFSEDYVILSQKLNEDEKKCLCRKLKCFLGEDQKERSSPKIKVLSKSLFSRNLVLYSTGILCLFRLIIQRSRRVASGGGIGPPFLFLPPPPPPPPDFYFCPSTYFLFSHGIFFLKVSIALTVKIEIILTVPSPIRTSIVFD